MRSPRFVTFFRDIFISENADLTLRTRLEFSAFAKLTVVIATQRLRAASQPVSL